MSPKERLKNEKPKNKKRAKTETSTNRKLNKSKHALFDSSIIAIVKKIRATVLGKATKGGKKKVAKNIVVKNIEMSTRAAFRAELSTEREAEVVAALNVEIAKFVEKFSTGGNAAGAMNSSAGAIQRSAQWYADMGHTVGGSEMAALLDLDPYKKREDVIMGKATILRALAEGREPPNAMANNAACNWGSLFEDVIARVIEADLDTTTYGDSICVREFEGHRNSPDGYCVVTVFDDSTGRIATDASSDDTVVMDEAAIARIRLVNQRDRRFIAASKSKCAIRRHCVLLEYKCPLGRVPTGKVPPQYVPQCWSGLMVSPFADFALFVDAMFRKCALTDLGPSPTYDNVYHTVKPKRANSTPLAWGVIAVYVNTPPGVEPASDFGVVMAQLTDFGASGGDQFEDALAHIAEKTDASVEILAPEFRRDVSGLPDTPYFTPDDWIAMALAVREKNAQEKNVQENTVQEKAGSPARELVGVIPWKLFDLCYVPVARREGFRAEIEPLIKQVHQRVAEATKALVDGGDAAEFAERKPTVRVYAREPMF